MTKLERITALIGDGPTSNLPLQRGGQDTAKAVVEVHAAWFRWNRELCARIAELSVDVSGFYDSDSEACFTAKKHADDTHIALLICIEPLKHGVTKDEIVRTLRAPGHQSGSLALATRIEQEGILP